MRKIIFVLSFILLAINTSYIFAYDWPLKDFSAQHPIIGVFGEFRSTPPQMHFHEGADIGAPEGTSVYTIDGGTVTWGGSGDNTYVKVGNKAYIHLKNRKVKDKVVPAGTEIGEVNSLRHVHLQENSGTVNPLRNNGLSPYVDTDITTVWDLVFYRQGTHSQVNSTIYGQVDIRSRASDRQSNGSASVGIYKIGYEVQDSSGDVILGPLCNIQFNTFDQDNLAIVYDTTTSNTSTYYYWVTNTMTEDRYWNTKLRSGGQWNGTDAKINSEAAYKDGRYTAWVLAYDIKNNGGDKTNKKGAEDEEITIDNFRPYVTGVIIGTSYNARWEFNDPNLKFVEVVNDPIPSGTHSVTIMFSEPVTNATLSIDTIGAITLSSSEPQNNQKIFTGNFTIPPNASGDKTLTISAKDLAGNQILQIGSGTTLINPATQLTRDTNGAMQGTGGNDTVHVFTVGQQPIADFSLTCTPIVARVPKGKSVSHTISLSNNSSLGAYFSLSAHTVGPTTGWQISGLPINKANYLINAGQTDISSYMVTNTNAADYLDVEVNAAALNWAGGGGFIGWSAQEHAFDHPDETYDISDGYAQDWLIDTKSNIGILLRGFGDGIGHILGGQGIRTAPVKPNLTIVGEPTRSLNDLKVLIIGSAALTGMDSSPTFKEKLADCTAPVEICTTRMI